MKAQILSFEYASRKQGMDFLNVGPTPHNEPCTQAGYEHLDDGVLECEVYIRQLIRALGEPPVSCEFFIIENHHEFGVYHDVNIMFPERPENLDVDEPAVQTMINTMWETVEEYIIKAEEGLDAWDEEAKQELIDREHHLYVAKIVKLKTA